MIIKRTSLCNCVTIHAHASFCKVLFDKGANCKRDCPFKVAFGEGQSLWPHNCTGSTPISGVIGVGVKSNAIAAVKTDVSILSGNRIKELPDSFP